MIGRVVVGFALFCVLPALIGWVAIGTTGLLWGLLFPAGALVLGALLVFGLLVEWVFGTSPQQYAQREREGS